MPSPIRPASASAIDGTAPDRARPPVCWLLWGDEPIGGVRRALMNFAGGLRARGWPVQLLCLDDGPLVGLLRAQGYEVHCLHNDGQQHARYAATASSGRLGQFAALRQLRAYRQALTAALGRLRPAVVSVYWPDFLPLVGGPCRQLGIRLLWEMPEVPSVYRFRLNQRIYAALLAWYRVKPIANSRFSGERLGQPRGLAVVYPPSDPAQFDPARVRPWRRADWQLPEDAILLGAVARLSPQKCGEALIQALAIARREEPQLHLVFVGGPLDSPYAETLRALVQRLRLEAFVHFIPAVEDPAPAQAMMDLILSCRPDAEGFGLSIVEAMLMQKPVLARALGGPAETVQDGITGWHLADAEPTTIAAGIARALAERPRWPAMGAAARQRAIEHYSLAVSLPAYERCLRAEPWR